jgi:cysteine-rich repeat protein
MARTCLGSLFVSLIVLSVVMPGCDDGVLPWDGASPPGTQPLPPARTAEALSCHYVALALTKAVKSDLEMDFSNCTITAPDLTELPIRAARLNPDQMHVILTTDAQSAVAYQLSILSGSGGGNPLTFTGSTEPEPALHSAVSMGATSVMLQFTEPMDAAATERVTCYEIRDSHGDKELVVEAGALQPGGSSLMLTTSEQERAEYTVRVKDATASTTGNLIDPTQSTATFVGNGDPLPRVVGANSTSNTTVVVAYSKPMADSATDPSHYTIVQENVYPEAGALAVLEARFVGPDRVAVELTTRPQSEVTYAVTVVNVTDQLGNSFGPKSTFSDPTRATFAGTPPSGPAIDTDNDGLSDNEEQRGWAVYVVLAGGEVTMRDVTSDPTMADTDGDGLDDAQEKRRISDPRDPDTDDDLLDDHLEATRLTSSPTNQDTDRDGIDDFNEVTIYKTSPVLVDTDGDGFDDAREVFELNRHPRVADMPRLAINIGDMALRIDERFVDQTTHAVVTESSSSTTLARSEQTQFSSSDTDSTQWFVEGGVEIGLSHTWGLNPSTTLGGKISAKGGYSSGDVSQESVQSAQEAQEVYQSSLSKAQQFAATVTREVVGASMDSSVVLQNNGDVAFTVGQLEIAALLPSRMRDRFVPVATLLPSSELITGDEAEFNLAPHEEKGPIIISNREIYPNLVEDLMRNPRGLIFDVANYDITDEFGRNIAFQQEEMLGRTAVLTIDPGDGTFRRYSVATSGAFGGRCDGDADNPGAICDDDIDCPGGSCQETFFGGYDEDGEAIPLPMDFVLQQVLALEKNATQPDAIVAGINGRVDTVAVADDIQVVPIGTTGLNDRTIILLAGENGILDTFRQGEVNNADSEGGDDVPAVTTGYETSRTCNADTSVTINEPEFDGDGIASTQACADSPLPPCAAGMEEEEPCCDDVQRIPVGEGVTSGRVIVSAGANGIMETVVRGDDEFRGPGRPCTGDRDCRGGACDGGEVLVRFQNSKTGDPNRFWVVLTSEETCYDTPQACETGIPAGSDFGDVPLRPTEAVTFAFGQDIDRDGLFAREEFIYGSSDQSKDTDADTLGDFAEIRVGWTVDVVGEFPEQVFPDARFRDSDFDGLEDPDEQDCLTDPSKRDTDGDGLFDIIELGVTTDFDGDGLVDDFEQAFGRCCSGVAGSCASEPTVPCRTDEDCRLAAPRIYRKCRPFVDFSGVCPPPTVPPQWPERLDPRNPDTDGDTIADGEELDLELNPLDPTDAGAFRDSDQDGLTDVEERAGWEVEITLCSNRCSSAFSGNCDEDCDEGTDCADCTTCAECPPAIVTRQVFPDPSNGDSDFDGLPDLLEAMLGSDPLDDDTDADGLLDYDEFDDFGAYATLNAEYEGFFLVQGDSQTLGTSLTSQDSDLDGLPDAFEQMEGWRVLVPGEGPIEVFSEPQYSDSDLDDLTDLEEYLGADGVPAGRLPDDRGDATDPSNADTDGDGRFDGADTTYCRDGQYQGRLCVGDCDCCDPLTQSCCNEPDGCCGNRCLGPNPLLADMSVKVSLVRIDKLCGPQDGGFNDWRISFKVKRPLQNEQDTLLDALHLQRLMTVGEDEMPPDQTQWGLQPLANCEPVCSSLSPPVMFPPGHPQREYCTIESLNINCGGAGLAPIEFDGVDSTFSVPLGDPFVVEVHFQEAESCRPDGTPQASCDLFLEEDYDSAALTGTPFLFETKNITAGSASQPPQCEVTVIYEVQVASFAWEPDTFETSCSNLTDDDQDGYIDCADTDCDFAGFCEYESGGYTADNGWVYDPATTTSYGLTSYATWLNAEAEAVALGAHLVAVGSAAENQWLLQWLLTVPEVPSTVWIGYSDATWEGHWFWSNGEPTTYTNWESGEPNNSGNEDFAVMEVNYPGWTPGSWNDVRGTGVTRGIIEKYRHCMDYGTCQDGTCSNDAAKACVTDADCPIDNDGDGLANCLDMGCSFADNCETGDRLVGDPPMPICDNGLDDDEDGFVDCEDFGCSNAAVCLCGDGIIQAGEECDDGNENNFDDCRNDCTLPYCGDGITDPDESCDGASAANCNQPCRVDCTCCGDGTVDDGEECDDGNDDDDDDCANDCTTN